MALALPDARRVRSYFLRLPLATRLLLFLLTVFYFAQIISPGLDQWGALIPNEITLTSCKQVHGMCQNSILTCRSIPTEHLSSPPPRPFPLPPQYRLTHTAAREIRKRSWHCSDHHSLYGDIWSATRRPLHRPRTLHLPPQWRSHRRECLGLPPSRQRKHKAVEGQPFLLNSGLSHTDVDDTTHLHPRR